MNAHSYKFPAELLDLLPTMSNDRKSITAPPFPVAESSTPLLAGDIDAREVLDSKRLQAAASQCPYSTQQKDNAVWVNLRPRWWPSFAKLKDCGSWRIYAAERARLMAKKERYQPRYGFVTRVVGLVLIPLGFQ